MHSHVMPKQVAANDNDGRLINEGEAAEYLGVSVRTLQNWRVRGGGPRFVKLGGHSVRYRIRDLEAWIDAHTCANTTERAGK